MSRIPVRLRLVTVVVAVTAGALLAAIVFGTARLEGALVDRQFRDAATEAEVLAMSRPGQGFDVPSGNPIVRSVSGPSPGITPDDGVTARVAQLVDGVRSSDGSSALFARLHGWPDGVTPVLMPNGRIVMFDTAGGAQVLGDLETATLAGPIVPWWTLDTTAFVQARGQPGLIALSAGENLEYRTVPVRGVDLVVARSTTEVRESVDRVRRWSWWLFPAVLAVAGVVAWWFAGRALRPVARMTGQVARIDAASSEARVAVPPTRDEIARLAMTMNQMLDRIAAADAARRQFVSDASHELRSPVAVLRSEADNALAAPERADVAAFAGTVQGESERLARIVDDLLVLARHDEHRPALDRRETDLDDIVLAEAARPRGVPVDVHAVSAGRVDASPEGMRRVVQHLLDNAARHASARVEVSLGAEDGHVVLCVDDDGDGVPVEQRTAVFGRFARLDAARSRDRGGAGLGLAVVDAVVDESGGSVHVEDAPLGGARFVVRLPAA